MTKNLAIRFAISEDKFLENTIWDFSKSIFCPDTE